MQINELKSKIATAPFYESKNGLLYCHEIREFLKLMPDKSVDCIVTSPPYYAKRDYGESNQIGLETNFHNYLNNLTEIFIELKRILKDRGTCWVVIDDTYGGSGKGAGANLEGTLQGTNKGSQINNSRQKFLQIHKKSLFNIPGRFASNMIDSGWILRNEIIWFKKSAMPSSVKDRFTINFEKIFFFTKSRKYYFKQQLEPYQSTVYDQNKPRRKGDENYGKKAHNGVNNPISPGIRDWYSYGGRNMRTVWDIISESNRFDHFAVFPTELVKRCLNAGCEPQGIVFDPFMGSGTTAFTAQNMGLNWIGVDLSEKYCEMTKDRVKDLMKW